MDNNEIMVNEDLMETTEMMTTNSGNSLKMAAGIGLAIVVGGMAYKYAAKPMIAKIKAKRESKKINEEDIIDIYDDYENESEDAE